MKTWDLLVNKGVHKNIKMDSLYIHIDFLKDTTGKKGASRYC